jgi:AraC-like DNA-binding protein
METKNKVANQSYYKIKLDPRGSDVADYDVDLMVNCCGEAVMRIPWAHGRIGRRNDFYLIYSLGGDMVGQIGGEPVTIGSGDLVCMLPGTEYSFGSRSPLDEWTHYFWIHFTGCEAERTLLRSGITPGKVYSLGQCEEAFAYYEKLFSEFRTQGEDFEYSAAVQLRYLLYVFGKAAKENAVGRLDKSIRYIHTHLRYELTVESLAAMEFLGVSRYRDIFRSVTGVSPLDYITRLRIERAKDLLSQNGSSVAEVAEAVGYTNRNYFQRLFKKYTGKTPGEFRKK